MAFLLSKGHTCSHLARPALATGRHAAKPVAPRAPVASLTCPSIAHRATHSQVISDRLKAMGAVTALSRRQIDFDAPLQGRRSLAAAAGFDPVGGPVTKKVMR